MRKGYILLMLLFLSSVLKAQDLAIGIHAGILFPQLRSGLSKYNPNQFSYRIQNNDIGKFGILTDVKLDPFFNFQTGVYYHRINMQVVNSRFDRPGVNHNIRYRYEQEVAGLEVPLILQYKAELSADKQWVFGGGINFLRRQITNIQNQYQVFESDYSSYLPQEINTSYRNNRNHWDADLMLHLGYQHRPATSMGYEVGMNYQFGLGLLPYVEIENSYQVEQRYQHGSPPISESFRSQIQPSLQYVEIYLRLYPAFLQYRRDSGDA